ncbi:S1-like domain-containing protein [Fulvia fulva]|uniref:S1-like domain-containing protein n=1 Tax=Passalora fulva TaxID=5499 RepID=A0A9Q8PDR3_PASFU|nr:S1-like domain-containing protein [Fulvia fulva]KAK4617603.1 S1-like domain-containing protein [Fulvia fulva]KAK4618763.1 S1-like domain-containing protein [Fulvia fulva]UJO20552.1 S1-like domain-containing protein [Fulvia fulva]WPV18071.1 S1-like domain-containing protein [Fulvia fulva]WPV33024.1 S1-like domain-containing protein [Fulvia fulva]
MPKPKRLTQAVQEETLTPPATLPAGQKIARVKSAAGNNLYNLELPSGEALLAELDAKFRSTIWMKRGSYVLVDTTSLAERGNKLGGEIVNIVGDVKVWSRASFWPKEFSVTRSVQADSSDEESDAGPQMPPSDDED